MLLLALLLLAVPAALAQLLSLTVPTSVAQCDVLNISWTSNLRGPFRLSALGKDNVLLWERDLAEDDLGPKQPVFRAVVPPGNSFRLRVVDGQGGTFGG
jgi:hypothetical protein